MAPFLDYYLKSATNTRLYTGYIRDNQTPNQETGNGYEHVYFGIYKGKPIEWNVISKETDKFNSEANLGRKTMFLDCRRVLENDVYSSTGSRWRDSNAKKVVEKIYKTSCPAFKYVVQSYKEFPSVGSNVDASEPLENEYFFLLDKTEITDRDYCYYDGTDLLGEELLNQYALKNYINEERHPYWLRSRDLYFSQKDYAHAVLLKEENIGYYFAPPALRSKPQNTKLGISPACNIDVTRILFTSKTSDHCARITFCDESKNISLANRKKVVIRGNDITIPFVITKSYSRNSTSLNAFSILILDKEFTKQNENNANILYYKTYEMTSKVQKDKSIAFKWPTDFAVEEWGKSYRVYILAETVAMAEESDFATQPYEIKESKLDKETYTVTFDLGGKKGETPAKQTVIANGLVTRPANPNTDGYDFQGWYNGNSLYSFGTPVTSNLKLVAKWIKSTQYNLWVGDTHVSNLNCKKIPMAKGSASFDPKTNTLTFDNGAITSVNNAYKGRTAAIYATNIPLTIKGSVDIDVPEADHSILVSKSKAASTTTLTLDGNITTSGSKYAVMSIGMNIRFAGGMVEIKDAKKNALVATNSGKISFADNMTILSPEESTIKRTATLSVLHEKKATRPSTSALIWSPLSGTYQFWVGRTKVSPFNKKKIKCDKGYATYDPKSGTLTFENAIIRHGHKLPYNLSAAIYSRNIPLTIKGNLEIDDDELDCGIRCDDFEVSKNKLTLNGNITMLVGKNGIYTSNKDVAIAGGCIDITACSQNGMPFNINGTVELTNSKLKVTSPKNARIRYNNTGSGYSYIYASAKSTEKVSSVTISSN